MDWMEHLMQRLPSDLQNCTVVKTKGRIYLVLSLGIRCNQCGYDLMSGCLKAAAALAEL